MMRSLFSAVSGLKTHQQRMDVIGNNIANVNTPGFQKSRVTFQDMLNQTIRGASSPTKDGRGGTNPMQVGPGVSIASIDTIFGGSSLQDTGKATDLGIDGDGFFILSDGDRNLYTRVGNFEFDSDGNLVNINGLHVKGWMFNGSDQISEEPENIVINFKGLDIDSYTIDSTGAIIGIKSDGTSVKLAQVALATFINPAGLFKEGNSLYSETANSGDPEPGVAGSIGFGTIRPGSLEMSNVDLSSEFTDMIITQRGFQANSRVITTSDEMLQELVNLKR